MLFPIAIAGSRAVSKTSAERTPTSPIDVRPGRFIQTSFDFEKPRAELETRRLAPLPHALADGELYCYPACYTAVEHGNHLARIRLEAEQAALLAGERRAVARRLLAARDEQAVEALLEEAGPGTAP